ncbi:MAG: type II secretion system protein [Clostridia bacterium]|nr:type II secretion system protein [Clostridia bacterium]
MKNKKDIQKNAGITLIALVVTIIILLILVGVTISSFTGDDGLVNETKNTKNNIEDLQNKTMDDLHQIANELSTSAGDALNP